MKKILSQIALILLIILIGTVSVLINEVKADSKAGLSVPSSANINSSFNVALILPENAYSAQATITVTFSDGTTQTKNIVYMSGMADFPNNVSFTASKAGNAKVTATNIIISDSSSNSIEKGGSKEGSITINDPNASSGSQTTPTPTPTPTPNTSTSTSTNTSSVTFSDVNETVYLTENCNLRESYSTSSKKIKTLYAGVALTRTGVGNNGWSRISYNGASVYVSSQYLTTTNPNASTTTNNTNTVNNTTDTNTVAEVEFKSVNKTMYAKSSCNVRESYSTSSKKVGYLNKGQEVKVTGTASNGWTRIEYEKKVAYVSTKLLSSEVVEVETENNTVENNTVNNTVTNDAVSANEIKTKEEQLAEIKSDVGVLPEVGYNIANNLHIVAIVIALSSSALLVLYIKKFNI